MNRNANHVELFWMRETARDAGVLVPTSSLEPSVRGRVTAILAGAPDRSAPLRLYLPFMDKREWRRRAEILRNTMLVEDGGEIRSIAPTINSGIRNHAAHLVGAHPAWLASPQERDKNHFAVWQKVSLSLQKAMRQWIPQAYFEDVSRYEDRPAAYPLLVYSASRLCFGMPRTEFTYDVADSSAVLSSWRMIGRALQDILSETEQRLRQADRPELARRYGPRWYEDITRAVKQNPRPYIALLAQEAALIDAVIGLGSAHDLRAVKPFTRAAARAMRRTAGLDLRGLIVRSLDEATRVLSEGTQSQQAAA